MIWRAAEEDCGLAARLACMLWPDHAPDEMAREMADCIASEDAAVFLALQLGQPAGVAQCGLRRDYVEGTGSSPVGYLEGIYVCPEFRRRGIAARLVESCEQWAREKGVEEFASDCELDNLDSLSFHLKLGFRETNRIICFVKKL